MYSSQYIPDLETTVDNNITYCTPELSDFCIGFQYDILKDGNWINEEFNTEYRVPSKQQLIELIKTKKVRTYALDKYSLEKLGFKKNPFMDFYEKKHSDEWIQVVIFHKATNIKYDYLTIEFLSTHRMGGMLVFKGVVRTVSEMQKLLNQTDIVY